MAVTNENVFLSKVGSLAVSAATNPIVSSVGIGVGAAALTRFAMNHYPLASLNNWLKDVRYTKGCLPLALQVTVGAAVGTAAYFAKISAITLPILGVSVSSGTVVLGLGVALAVLYGLYTLAAKLCHRVGHLMQSRAFNNVEKLSKAFDEAQKAFNAREKTEPADATKKTAWKALETTLNKAETAFDDAKTAYNDKYDADGAEDHDLFQEQLVAKEAAAKAVKENKKASATNDDKKEVEKSEEKGSATTGKKEDAKSKSDNDE